MVKLFNIFCLGFATALSGAFAFDGEAIDRAEYEKAAQSFVDRYEELGKRAAKDEALFQTVKASMLEVRNAKDRKTYEVTCYQKAFTTTATWTKDDSYKLSMGPADQEKFTKFAATIANERDGVFSLKSQRGLDEMDNQLEAFTKAQRLSERTNELTFGDHSRKGFYLVSGSFVPTRVKLGPFKFKLGKGRLGYQFSVSPLDEAGDVYFEIQQDDTIKTEKNANNETVEHRNSYFIVCH